MIVKPLPIELLIKEENQALTEASSELNGETVSLSQWKNQENGGEEEGTKKGQKKLKYRKLKQKLNSMGFQHDDKCVAIKDFTSPKKQRIMKLALDFERMIKIQNRDYYSLEITSRQIQKIIQSKNQLDLHLLRQSRFLPAVFELLQKVPSLHKAQFSQLLKCLEICFNIIYSFASNSTNRQYLILTNRLNSLVSFIIWIIGREEKRPTLNSVYYSIQNLSFKLVNLLLLHKSKEQDICSISNTTIQLIICSQLFKKIKIALTQQFYSQETLSETQVILQIMKFMLYVIRKSQTKFNPIYSLLPQTPYQQSSKQQIIPQINCKTSDTSLAKLLEFIIPFLISYFNLLQETEQPIQKETFPRSYPTIVESLMLMVIKILNSCFEASFLAFKKIFVEISKQGNVLNFFLQKLNIIIKYCLWQFQESLNNSLTKSLLNEIIVFLGYISTDDQTIQKKIYESQILDKIFNLPIQYIMDSHLRQIYIPTFCSLIYQNKTNLNLLLKDNSPQPIIKFLKKQIQSKPSLHRKNSTSSLMSFAGLSNQYNALNYEAQRLSLQMRFPQVYWQILCSELQKHM